MYRKLLEDKSGIAAQFDLNQMTKVIDNNNLERLVRQ